MAARNGVAISEAISRLQRLDAKVKASPGQMGLDLTAASSGGDGQPCGKGWIPRDKTCHKGAASAPYNPTPKVSAGLTQKPMTFNNGGDTEYNPATEKTKAKGGLKYYRSQSGGTTKYNYFFRDRQAAEHWYADDNAKSDADIEVGASERRSREWQAEYKASYAGTRNLLRDASDHELLKTIEAYAASGTATGRGAATDVRIAGNKHSRPIREGTFGKDEPEQPVLTNPGREDPGLAPVAKQTGLNALDVTTSAQQVAFARQQQQAAAATGDRKGAQAWKQEARKVEQQRLQGAINRTQQSQGALFGVTEYDETMPLFRQRRDSVDPVAQLLGQILADELPGAQVLDWSRHPKGVTAGRVASEGLVYRFRCDADSIGYRPGWEGVDERQWELRSEGFLMARDPAARMDYRGGKGLKFQQQRSKRQCTKGYGCGSACISLNKECRITPGNAISKARLKQLQALATEGDATAAAKAQELQMQRDTKAKGLREGRQVDQLKKLLQDPRVAEMVRTGKVPTETAASAAPKPGDVRNIKPTEVEVDPQRFQYKIGASASGEVGSLSGVQKWDPNLAGVISVWQDPEDSKTYVVNGHNRLALAKRLGAEEVTVRFLNAKSAKEARAIGAMQNIAEGAGKETDAAKFFRDSGITSMEQVQSKGLPLNSGKAQRGLALAQLPDEMFQDVIQGELRVRRAAVIGGSGLDQDKQREVYKVLKQRPSMTDETLQEYVEHLAVSQRQTQTEINLFGSDTKSVDTGLARAELSNGLKKALSKEARLLGAVSKNSAAVELLEQRGGNVINVEQSQQEAQEASQVLRIFNQLKGGGGVGSALDQAAARVTAGESKSKVQRELREAVIQAMEDELRQLGLRKEPPKNEAPTMSMFDSSDRIDSLMARIDAVRRKCQTGYACGSTCISPAKECRSEGKASTGRERLRKLEEAAAGGKVGRGIGQLRGESAAAKAQEIRGARSAQAASLRQQRAQRRPAAGSLARTGQSAPTVTVVNPEVMSDEPQARRPGGIASTMRETLNAMKAADARQMGMVAEQLFETSWLVERRNKYRGMSKDQAREQFKTEFMQKLHKEVNSGESAARRESFKQKVGSTGSIAGAMEALIQESKASDDRLNDLTRRAIDLRVTAMEGLGSEGDAPILGGSRARRRLTGRRDAAEQRFDALITRLSALSAAIR